MATIHGRQGLGRTAGPTAHEADRISWGAVLAGAVIALFAQMILGLLGIGLGMEDAHRNAASPAGLAAGNAGVWWLGSGVAAAFLGGLAAGGLSPRRRRLSGAMHGLVSWAAAALAVYYLLSTAFGGLVGGAFSAVASAVPSGTAVVSGTGEATVTAPGTPLPSALAGLDDAAAQAVSDEVSAILGDISAAADEAGTDPTARRELETAVERFLGRLTAGEPADHRPLRAALTDIAGLTTEQAEATLEGWQARIGSVLRRAGEAATAKSRALAAASLWAVAALVLGAVAAAAGGAAVSPRRAP
jgi:hypothetical protein